MITTVLISIGLLLMPLLPMLGFQGKIPQIHFGMAIATALCLWGYFTQEQRPLRNKWLLFFCGYLLISAWQSPYPVLKFLGGTPKNFWVWKSMFFAFMFLGMYRTISFAKLTEKHKDLMFDIIVYTTAIMAVYCIGQRFGLMQWFSLTARYAPEAGHGFVRAAGTLGAPTFVSPYIMLGIPLALYRKKWLLVIPMLAGIIATNSQMAMGSAFIMLAALACFKYKKWRSLIITGVIALAVVLGAGKIMGEPNINRFVQDSARFANWKKMAISINTPYESERAYPYTGRGPGAFKWTYHLSSKTNYYRAHNEYLEVLYDTGIVGIFLFIMSLIYIFLNTVLTERNKYLMSAFIGICVCAGGAFVWHLGATMFLTVLIAGLLNNKELQNG